MMRPRTLFVFVVGSLAVAAPSVALTAETVKIATLAPSGSMLGTVFRTWSKAASEKSGGKLDVQLFWNGTQGDESSMITKIKSGQLDGAAVSSLGLSKVNKNILALQIPGLCNTWAKLDKARTALQAELEKGASDAGFTILGWGDLGLARSFAKGFAPKSPNDLKGKKPAVYREDLIGPTIHQTIGSTPVPQSPTEILGSLSSGAVNVINAPALVVEQLQWAPRLDHVSDTPFTAAIGGFVVSKKKLDALPADLKKIFLETGKVAGDAMKGRARTEDDAAYARLKAKMTVFSPDMTAWKPVLENAVKKLVPSTFPADLVQKIKTAAGP
jgi:TRAP-type C4-dicarboxylate transport system substrate-binding protein